MILQEGEKKIRAWPYSVGRRPVAKTWDGLNPQEEDGVASDIIIH